jgi:hypothetical protein
MRITSRMPSSIRGRVSNRPGVQLEEVSVQVSSSTDDGDERTSTNEMFVSLASLRLGVSVNANMRVGIRFQGIGLSPGAFVSLARLSFVSNFANSDALTVRIRAQAHDNAPALTSDTGNLTSRSTTTSYVDWVMPAWSPEQNDGDTLSPDLSEVVQEVLNRPGWTAGNAMVFLIDHQSGVAQRRPYTFDSDPTKAARLTINNVQVVAPPPPVPPPSSVGSFGDGFELYGLEGNSSFNAASPTLKNGNNLTGQMLSYYTSLIAWVQKTNATHRLNEAWNTFSIQSAGRQAQPILSAVMSAFRVTGDLRLLDYCCAGLNVLSSKLDLAWSGHVPSRFDSRTTEWATAGVVKNGEVMVGNPWSPYLGMNFLYSTTAWFYGTDSENGTSAKLWALVAEITWALWLNRNKTSPSGIYNYQTVANLWRTRVENHARTWSETTTAHWRHNYRGVESVHERGHNIPNLPSSTIKRQDWGRWPILLGNDSHTSLDCIAYNHYVGLLARVGFANIPNQVINGQYESDIACQEMVKALFIGNPHPSHDTYEGPWGTAIAMARDDFFSGADRRTQLCTYTGYMAQRYIQFWLTGVYRASNQLSRVRMLRLARGYAYMFNGTTGEMYPNVLRLADGEAYGSFIGMAGSVQTASTNALYGRSSMLVFSDSDTTLNTISTNTQNNHGGGYASPNYGSLIGAQFLRAVLEHIGDLD